MNASPSKGSAGYVDKLDGQHFENFDPDKDIVFFVTSIPSYRPARRSTVSPGFTWALPAKAVKIS